jgi:predicted GNAT family acetyltransferase
VELNLDDLRVFHDEVAHRFELQVAGLRALLTYRRFPDRLIIDHTEVPKPVQGKGLAAKLASSALDFARENHLRVVPLCPYVSGFLRRHLEYQDLLSADDLNKLRVRSADKQ